MVFLAGGNCITTFNPMVKTHTSVRGVIAGGEGKDLLIQADTMLRQQRRRLNSHN